MPPVLLARVLERMRHAGVRYCVLRGTLTGPAPHGHRELDVLVDPRQLATWSREVRALGFMAMPVLGSGGHRFFTRYDTDGGEWLKLDVVTELRFGGRGGLFSMAGRDRILDRATTANDVRTPHPVDATLGLVLHCLLDKRAFKDEHRKTLAGLRDQVMGDGALNDATEELFTHSFDGALSWRDTADAIARGNWPGLLARRTRVTQVLFRRDPIGTVGRGIDEVLRRIARPLHAVLARRGYSIALIGPDGTGKSSLARRLAADREIHARIVYMGSNPKASTVGLWRGGANSFAPRLLEQAYRSAVASFWKLRGHFVVFERHPWEGRNAPVAGGASRLRRALLLAASAQPDLVVVLDAPLDLLADRTPEHERERITSQRERYRALAGQIAGATVLDTSHDLDRTIRDLTTTIWDGYRRHVEGGEVQP